MYAYDVLKNYATWHDPAEWKPRLISIYYDLHSLAQNAGINTHTILITNTIIL